MNKQKENKGIDADNRLVVTRGKGEWGRAIGVKDAKYMLMDGKQTFGGEHTIVYADIKL